MKIFKTLISVVLCAVVLLAGFAAAKPESLKASAVISDQKKTVNPFSQTISWGGFDKTKGVTITYSNTAMITPSNTKFNGNDTYTFKVNENYSSTDRTCVITAKNGSTTKKYTVTQRGKIVTISPSYTGSTINGNGQELSFVITSNLRFEVHRFQQGSKIGYVGTFGSNTASGTPNSYTVKVSFPANTSGATKYGLGIWVQASNQVATKTYTQPSHTHVWGATVTTIAPKCTECGEGYHTCSLCGARENVQVIPRGHQCTSTTLTSPTCTKKGTIRVYCTNPGCDYSFTTTTTTLRHNYTVRWTVGQNVYVQCTRSGCNDRHNVYSYANCKYYITNVTQKEFVQAMYYAQGGSSKNFETYYSNLSKTLAEYQQDGNGKKFLSALYGTTSNSNLGYLTQLGELLGNDFCEKFNKFSTAYNIAYSMYKLLETDKNAPPATVGNNMMNLFEATMSLNPFIDATYGKIVGELYTAGVKIIEDRNNKVTLAGLYGELTQNAYDGYMVMSVPEVVEQYYSLFAGNTSKARLFLTTKVAYEYHKVFINPNYTGTFEAFIDPTSGGPAKDYL